MFWIAGSFKLGKTINHILNVAVFESTFFVKDCRGGIATDIERCVRVLCKRIDVCFLADLCRGRRAGMWVVCLDDLVKGTGVSDSSATRIDRFNIVQCDQLYINVFIIESFA